MLKLNFILFFTSNTVFYPRSAAPAVCPEAVHHVLFYESDGEIAITDVACSISKVAIPQNSTEAVKSSSLYDIALAFPWLFCYILLKRDLAAPFPFPEAALERK